MRVNQQKRVYCNGKTTKHSNTAGKGEKRLAEKIGTWFASPDGMQTLRFISAIVAVIAVGVICALLGIYMDKDNFLPKERNYALIGACAIELALIFIIAKFFSIQKKLKRAKQKAASTLSLRLLCLD